jgi:hypothetical protein
MPELGIGRAEGAPTAGGGPRARRESVRDHCPFPRLGSDEVASFGRRGPHLNRACQSFMVCSEDVFQPCLGALGVPLITVPDSISMLSLACSIFLQVSCKKWLMV